jgi:hypothetical protein
MRRVNSFPIASLIPVLFCVFALSLPAAPRGNSAANQADAPTLLARATAHTNIESPSSMPFVMLARVRYTLNKQTVEGTYALGWAAPNLYREDFQYGNVRATILVTGGKLYRTHVMNGGPGAVDLWSRMIKRALQWSLPLGTHSKERPQGEHWQSAAQLTCIVADRSALHHRICLDPNNYEPYSYEANGQSGKQNWTFADYTLLANAASDSQRFPTAITYRDNNGISAELDIQSIAAVPGFAADEFTPPPGATAEDFPGKAQ